MCSHTVHWALTLHATNYVTFLIPERERDTLAATLSTLTAGAATDSDASTGNESEQLASLTRSLQTMTEESAKATATFREEKKRLVQQIQRLEHDLKDAHAAIAAASAVPPVRGAWSCAPSCPCHLRTSLSRICVAYRHP